PLGKSDLALPERSRVYLIAGTQHGGRAGLKPTPGVCANPTNPHSPGPALRALTVALENWLTRGIAPPASRVPTLAFGSAVPYAAAKRPNVKGFTIPPTGNRIDAPVDWIEGAHAANSYGTPVSAVDADGNEATGIRLPPIAVPIATYTGWNVYKKEPNELCDRDGSYIAFSKTKAEREAAGDPRLSLEERYGSRADYVANVKAAAEALVAEGLLLAADAARYVQEAETSDRF